MTFIPSTQLVETIESDDPNHEEPVFNQGLTNDVVIELDDGIGSVYALPRADGRMGTVDFDLKHEGPIGYHLEQIFGDFGHPVPAHGYLLVDRCRMDFGTDYWTGEVDAALYCGSIRPARLHEILVNMNPITLVKSWRIILDQLWLALWFNFNKGYFE